MAETNGRVRILDLGFGTETDRRDGGGGGDTCYVGVPRHVPFSWVYFLPKNSGAECQLKNCNAW